MESYGELLQKTRERKALDLDRVSREISIEKRLTMETKNFLKDNGNEKTFERWKVYNKKNACVIISQAYRK